MTSPRLIPMRSTMRLSSGSPAFAASMPSCRTTEHPDGIHDAGELDQYAIAQELDDPSMVFANQWLEDFRAAGLEGGQRSSLVRLHKPAVADHIRGQNGGKPTSWDVLLGHMEHQHPDLLQCSELYANPTKSLWQLKPANGLVRPCSWPLSARRLAGGTKRKEHAMSNWCGAAK